jgi:hypothetical protein
MCHRCSVCIRSTRRQQPLAPIQNINVAPGNGKRPFERPRLLSKPRNNVGNGKRPFVRPRLLSVPRKIDKNTIQQATNAATSRTNVASQARKTALRICEWLSANCHNCKQNGCDGDMCSKGCFCCGSTKHFARECALHPTQKGNRILKDFLVGRKICVFCYGWKTDEAHGVPKGGKMQDLRCPMKKRLRAILFSRGRLATGDFLDFIRETYASEETFITFLCSLNVDTKDRRLL